ncbi:class I SAM-dependent DNA methyltransferase [Helicobacter pylori]
MINFTRISLKDFIEKPKPQEPKKETIENFKKEINSLLEIDPEQSEEFQKKKINSFLEKTYDYDCNTHKKVDSAIYVDGEVWVLIEVKALNNKTEFPKDKENPLSKAFCQMVLYFLEEIKENNSLKHAIICNAHEFFLFDCEDLLFLNKDKNIKKFYNNCAKKEGTNSSKPKFYQDLEHYLQKGFQGKLRYTHFNLNDDEKLPLIYQVLSQEVLLKQKKTLDANTLNKGFYNELLYILGLKEQKDKGKLLINPSGTTNSLSDALKKQYKDLDNDDEKVMALLIAWNNRILFLRLLESLLISFGHFEKLFLTTENFNNFNALNTLFFEVLAKKNNERSLEKKDNILEKIPYLNSSLFDKTPLESNGYEIKLLQNERLEIYPNSILKKDKNDKKQKDLPLLEYLFKFLHAYDFTTTPKDIKDNKNTSEIRLINPSVLGLVFEKLNGYEEGSFYTPSFITSYMCKESITKIVLDKFNQTYKIECKDLTELKNYLKNNYQEDKRKEYLKVLLTLRVCDPAVGSGHFLVSALNEMVLIAYKLGLIVSLPLSAILELENDEILIKISDKPFLYTRPSSEEELNHQIQKELFELKKSIIENCLFGVDINPNSCEITKLRLWIELLKYSYYIFKDNQNTQTLETLPNIDINIKCGNSLISRFNLNDDLKKIPNIKKKIQDYKDLVAQYKDPNPLYPLNKADLINKIQDLKNTFSLTLKDPKTKAELEKAIEKHITKYNYFALDDKSLLDGLNYFTQNLFGTPKLSPKEEEEAFASYGRIRALRKKLDDALSGGEYQNAFEWRFEFPEVLNDEGDFLGFDLIIGNPPYIRQEEIKDKPLLEKQYKDFYASTADFYTYFFALAFNLLKEKGFNAFITSNKYARAKYGAKLRELLLKKTTIFSYMELNTLKVFESAAVDTSIMNFIKELPLEESRFNYYEPTDKDDLKSARPLLMRQNALKTESFIFADTKLLDLRDKMEKSATALKDWDIQINYGIKTGFNGAFIIPTEKRNEILNACKTQEERERTEALIKPILRGKDIKKYRYEWAGEWVINTHNGYTSAFKSKIPRIDIEKYPAIKAHLDSHYNAIVKRSDPRRYPLSLKELRLFRGF